MPDWLGEPSVTKIWKMLEVKLLAEELVSVRNVLIGRFGKESVVCHNTL